MSRPRDALPQPISDPLMAALARYIEALEGNYPGGPEELRRERLAIRRDRANMPAMPDRRQPPAA